MCVCVCVCVCEQNTGQNYSRTIADASFENGQNIDIWERQKSKFNAKKLRNNYIQWMSTTIWYSIFCVPVCYNENNKD